MPKSIFKSGAADFASLLSRKYIQIDDNKHDDIAPNDDEYQNAHTSANF